MSSKEYSSLKEGTAVKYFCTKPAGWVFGTIKKEWKTTNRGRIQVSRFHASGMVSSIDIDGRRVRLV